MKCTDFMVMFWFLSMLIYVPGKYYKCSILLEVLVHGVSLTMYNQRVKLI